MANTLPRTLSVEPLKGNDVTTANYYADCISRLKQTLTDALAKLTKAKEEEAKNGDKPHKALLKDYTTEAQVDKTFKEINAGLSEKWFENGDLKLGLERNPRNNGSTWMDGRTYLTAERLADVKSALGKIGKGRSSDITKDEADAMATFWHEITHNRNKLGNMRLTKTQTRYMELANEFVARKTLPEFYHVLGCKETPQPQFIESRGSTGYDTMVTNYDFVIKRLGLDFDKVLAEVKRNLFNEVYSDQATGLKNGLTAGGIKRLDGKKVKESDLNKILSLCKGCNWVTVENWLKSNGFMK